MNCDIIVKDLFSPFVAWKNKNSQLLKSRKAQRTFVVQIEGEQAEMGLTDPGWRYTTDSKWKKWKEREKLIGCIESFYFGGRRGIGRHTCPDSVSSQNLLTETALTAGRRRNRKHKKEIQNKLCCFLALFFQRNLACTFKSSESSIPSMLMHTFKAFMLF